MHFFISKSASLGVFDREFRGKEQQEKPRVREFRELWIASLRGLRVYLINPITHCLKEVVKLEQFLP